MYMVPEDIIPNAERLGKVMKENNITILHLTPQLFNQLAARDPGIFADLRILLVGGDLVRPRYVNLLRNKSKDLNVLHMYGPTENTTFSTFFPVDKDYDTTIPIGKPISNTRVYILDKHHRLQPIGVVGELCVGGAGVARGYLNNPELTTENFFDKALSSLLLALRRTERAKNILRGRNQPGAIRKIPGARSQELRPNHLTLRAKSQELRAKLYKTGDLARWLVKGNIQFLGRLDNQVKIRGYRVEPGEIENKLLQHESAAETLVTTTPEGDLCAFIVSSLEKEEFNMTELREYLAKELPPYMIPSYFVKMEKIPLTPSGKIDRRVLPVPAPGINKAKDYLAPRDETEEKMVKVWDEVLKVGEENISIDADFFELGGHSLKATIIISLIHKVFNLRLTLSEMFRQPTVRQLSGCVKESVKVQYKAIETAEEKEYYPLSSPQGRLYILQQFKEDDMTYHMPRVMILEGEPKVDRLEATFCRMIERHESLRTSFVMIGGEPVQKIHEEVEFEMEYYLTHETHEKHEKNEEIIKDFIRPFDLSKAPLLRVGLINLEKTKHILMIDMHHIISDGTSVGIFIEEFMALYHGEELPTILLQYKDFSEWQSSERGKQVINQQEHHWLQQFSREIPVLELPYNFSRPLERSFEGSSVSFKIGIEETEALKQLANEENVTMFMTLMAVYKVLLSKLSWSEDIVVGTPVVGRVNAEFQHIIGMFVNTLAIRSQPSREKTFNEFLKEIKEITSGAFENQAYPFENLVERVAAVRDASHHPLFDTMFTLQNIDIPEVEIPGLKLKPYEYNHPVSRFDMTWNGEEGEKKDTLCFTLEYNTSLFKRERIKRFAHYFK
jgi:acyl carrier protein